MAIGPTAKGPTGGTTSLVNERSTTPPLTNSRQSGVRGLRPPASSQAFEVARNQRQPEITPPPSVTLESVTAQYAGLSPIDATVLHLLETGDLPEAVIALMQENFRLRGELAASRSDFDELRSINIAQQEQADEKLAVADDQRVELLEQLERLQGELLDLESRSEQLRREHESELQSLRERSNA